MRRCQWAPEGSAARVSSAQRFDDAECFIVLQRCQSASQRGAHVVWDGKGIHQGHSHGTQLSAQVLHEPVDCFDLHIHVRVRPKAILRCAVMSSCWQC